MNEGETEKSRWIIVYLTVSPKSKSCWIIVYH